MSRLAVGALLACAVGLSACGGGGSDDKSDVEQVVRDFATATTEKDGDKFCDDVVSQEFLEQTFGATGDSAKKQCKDQIGKLTGSDITVVGLSGTKIDGDKATVNAELETQTGRRQQTFRLKREDDGWRLVASQ